MNSECYCPKCGCLYSESNPPKNLVECEHVLCLNCLMNQIYCPLDNKRLGRIKHKMYSFHTNTRILDIINNPPSPEPVQPSPSPSPSPPKHKSISTGQRVDFDVCLLHSKKADMVCLEEACRCAICANCGLFGEHQHHRIIPYDDFFEKYSAVSEQALSRLEELRERTPNWSEDKLKTDIAGLLEQRKAEQTRKVRQWVTRMGTLLKTLERQLLMELGVMMEWEEKRLMEAVEVDSFSTRQEEYQKRVMEMSEGVEKIMNMEGIEQGITYIDEKHSNSYLLKQGDYLLLEIDNFTKSHQQHVEQQVSSIGIELSEPKIELLKAMTSYQHPQLEQLHKVLQAKRQETKPKARAGKSANSLAPPALNKQHQYKSNTKLSPVQPSHKEQDDMLIDSGDKQQNVSGKGSQDSSPINILPPFNQLTPLSHRPELQFVRIPDFHSTQPLTLNPGFQPNRTVAHQKRERSGSVVRSSRRSMSRQNGAVLKQKTDNKKRMKNMQISGKCAKLLQDLKADKLDVLDLGGAELGDGGVQMFSDIWVDCAKLKSVKLMNNKISDEMFPILITNCQNISSLNLSYNQLTEKSLHYLQCSVGSLGRLSTITLSNNKIQLRTVKQRIQFLRRKGLNVSL